MVNSKYIKILDVIHPELANVSKDKLKEIIAKKYKVDLRSIIIFYIKMSFYSDSKQFSEVVDPLDSA